MKPPAFLIRSTRHGLGLPAAALLLACVDCPAAAQTAPAAKPATEEAIVLTPFTVSASQDKGYRASNSVSGSRIDTPIKDLPFALQAFTSDFITDLNPHELFDVIRYSPGVTTRNGDFAAGNAGNYAIRGFGTGSNPLRNGFAGPPIVDSVNVGAGVVADQGGRVSGTGTLGAVDINFGGTIASGNATGGTLTVASLKMAPSSNLEWRVWDASLGAGVGYSRLSVTGALDLSAGDFSTNKISLKLISLSAVGGSVNTVPTGFDPPAGTQRSFTLAQVGSVTYGAQTNISDYFSVDVSEFKYSDGSASAAGLWSISFDNANSAIMLTAVPEPSTYGFGLGALALAAAAIRRRRQIKKA